MRVRKISGSTYRSVSYVRKSNGEQKWAAKGDIRGSSFFSMHDTEREAAVAVDRFRIQCGVKPINILKQCEK